ncbi:hypothetical protein B0H19DRAFT_1275701 [Mycena capillaripes]|nr:hypothetical protein B0H19DRAFT_1275701 [Mycena capillaripes]
MSLPALDTLTGCILVGTWVSSLLYMLEIIQSVYYFRHFEHDDWKSKTLVTVALVVDGLSFIGDCICVYEYTITHAGDLEYLATLHWPLPLYGFTTGVLGVLVQTFLVSRYWRFTHKTFIALFLSLAIIISFGSVFTCSLMLTLYTSFEDRHRFKIPMALWLATEVTVDVGIAAVLLWEFRKAKGILTEARSALHRLTAVTIQSGVAAATLASGGLMGYYINPDSNLSLVFLYPLGRVYVITLLSNLNVRKSGKPVSTTGTSSVGPPTTRTVFMSTTPSTPLFEQYDFSYDPLMTVTPIIFKTVRSSCVSELMYTFDVWMSAYIDSWPEGTEIMATYSSKKHSTLFAA